MLVVGYLAGLVVYFVLATRLVVASKDPQPVLATLSVYAIGFAWPVLMALALVAAFWAGSVLAVGILEDLSFGRAAR